MANRNFQRAKADKNDEFYTRLIDIGKELRHYGKHFKGKTVYCNCDNPFKSNFFKYFVLNFNRLGLKKLIATCYGSDENKDKPYKAVVTKVYDTTGDDMLDVKELFLSGENELTELEGDGDFRSEECIELLEEADIVVTNPPFSLFREYVAQLVEYEKEFLIIGNVNAITYKEIFPLLKDNKIWIGAKGWSEEMYFHVSDEYKKHLLETKKEGSAYVIINGEILGRVATIWFTNLDLRKRHEDLILVKKYNPDAHSKYDNYDAINVNRVKDIPYDYDGVMGVPITFMDKYNPDQFEIIGSDFQVKDGLIDEIIKPGWDGRLDRGYLNGVRKYARILIKNKHPEINTDLKPYDAEEVKDHGKDETIQS